MPRHPAPGAVGIFFVEGKGHSLLTTLSGWLSRLGSAVPRRGGPASVYCGPTGKPDGYMWHPVSGAAFQCIPFTVSFNISYRY